MPERGRASSASPGNRHTRRGDSPIGSCCHGPCDCEACTLARMIDQDDRALWNERGQLVAPENLPANERTVHDPRQLSLRLERSATEKHHG